MHRVHTSRRQSSQFPVQQLLFSLKPGCRQLTLFCQTHSLAVACGANLSNWSQQPTHFNCKKVSLLSKRCYKIKPRGPKECAVYNIRLVGQHWATNALFMLGNRCLWSMFEKALSAERCDRISVSLSMLKTVLPWLLPRALAGSCFGFSKWKRSNFRNIGSASERILSI